MFKAVAIHSSKQYHTCVADLVDYAIDTLQHRDLYSLILLMKDNRDLNPSEVELFNTLLDDVYRWRKRDNIVINEVRDLHLILLPRR